MDEDYKMCETCTHFYECDNVGAYENECVDFSLYEPLEVLK